MPNYDNINDLMSGPKSPQAQTSCLNTRKLVEKWNQQVY